MRQRQEPLDEAVAALLTQAEKKKQARGGTVARQKTTVNLPDNLVDAIRQEAFNLTGHKRRGFSDLVTVLLRYGWEAYQAGDLTLEMQPAAVELRIMVAKK